MKAVYDLKGVPFPRCSDECDLVYAYGVCECEAACPEKFDKDGNAKKGEG